MAHTCNVSLLNDNCHRFINIIPSQDSIIGRRAHTMCINDDHRPSHDHTLWGNRFSIPPIWALLWVGWLVRKRRSRSWSGIWLRIFLNYCYYLLDYPPISHCWRPETIFDWSSLTSSTTWPSRRRLKVAAALHRARNTSMAWHSGSDYKEINNDGIRVRPAV